MGDGWGVAAVAGDDHLEEVSRLGGVVGVGGDEDEVLLAAAGHGDVEASTGRCGGGEGDAGDAGVGLVAGFAGGVAESDMFAHVVGWQDDGDVSPEPGGDDVSVVGDRGDGPGIAVADGLSGAVGEVASVVPGGDDITDVGHVLFGDDRSGKAGDVAAVDACGLEPLVDDVDVSVPGGGSTLR